jgi:hypothetical protein
MPGQVGHGFASQGSHLALRRSISPVPVMVNGGSMQSGNQNGGWIGLTHTSSKHSGPKEWMGDGRRHDMSTNDVEDEGRDGVRVRENRREKERLRERGDRERESEREQHDFERERIYHIQQQQQQQHHRHPLPGPHQHLHVPPGPSSHHTPGPHHHHHHHHHVVHHHHSNPGVGRDHSASAPPGHSLALSPRLVTSRDFDTGRSQSGSSRQTEIINLSSKPIISGWKGDDLPPLPDGREPRKHVGRPSSGPPMLDERERTLAKPFQMTYGTTSTSASANGASSLSNVSPPRHSWNNADDPSFRIPPPSSSAPVNYLSSADSHGNSPGHRYASSSSHPGRGPPPPSTQNPIGLSPPRPRPYPPSPSSSSSYIGPARSPTRFGPSHHNINPGLSPSQSHGTSLSTSPILKARRPGSPALGMKMGVSSGSVYSPRPTGPVRTTTPASLGPPLDLKSGGAMNPSGAPFGIGSRTASPLMTYLSPVQHPGQPPPRPGMNTNGVGRSDRDRPSPHLPPMPPPPKMNVAQMVDGR